MRDFRREKHRPGGRRSSKRVSHGILIRCDPAADLALRIKSKHMRHLGKSSTFWCDMVSASDSGTPIALRRVLLLQQFVRLGDRLQFGRFDRDGSKEKQMRPHDHVRTEYGTITRSAIACRLDGE